MARARIEVRHGNDELTFRGGVVTIGGRTGVDVVLDDVMVADRHCVVTFEDGFRLRDAGSVTGTWVDGQRAAPSAELRDGSLIVIGTTRIVVEVGDDDGTATLTLSVDPQSFYWQKSAKGAFDNDPDRLVYSEANFGRFPALQLTNRIAIVVGLVLLAAATLVSAAMEPLADAGPLMPAHALVAGGADDAANTHAGFQKCVELSGEQGCNVCHTTGEGTPESKCRQCHGLDGEMAAMNSLRHPYLGDGQLGAVPGMAVDEQFCVVCHTDHRGENVYKAASEQLVGNCATCHQDGQGTFGEAELAGLLAGATVELPPPQATAYATYRFPHDVHLAKKVDCATCHVVDPAVLADRGRGVPDDPARQDFADVPYEVCAACHVPSSPAVNMTAADQERWRADAPQWQVAWHGTEDGGRHCLSCHSASERNGSRVFGPELKQVERGVFSSEQYAAERARYTSPVRLHEQQFAQHADGRACLQCHVDGKIGNRQGNRPARTFWHGLHVREGSLTPADGAKAASISRDESAGCASCHQDLADIARLTPAVDGAYHWPENAEDQVACQQCHRERPDQPLLLTPAMKQIPAERRATVADFPHDVHMSSAAYGKAGTVLERGCFACHEFEPPSQGPAFAAVPRIRPEAATCTACHQGHDHVGGGSCQQCHPAVEGRSNSFLVSARISEPPPPTRTWPAPNGFSHLSPGHDMSRNESLTCATCHDGFDLDQAKTLADVRVPDEGAKLCRDCHLEKQFHWR